MMIEITGLDHLVLRTARLDQMRHFYCEILGCTVERELADFGLSQLRAGNSLIDLVTVPSKLGDMGGPAPAKQGLNLDHFCLQISAFSEAELVAYLQGFGVDCSDFSERYGAQGFGRSLYIQDPDGNSVELRANKS